MGLSGDERAVPCKRRFRDLLPLLAVEITADGAALLTGPNHAAAGPVGWLLRPGARETGGIGGAGLLPVPRSKYARPAVSPAEQRRRDAFCPEIGAVVAGDKRAAVEAGDEDAPPVGAEGDDLAAQRAEAQAAGDGLVADAVVGVALCPGDLDKLAVLQPPDPQQAGEVGAVDVGDLADLARGLGQDHPVRRLDRVAQRIHPLGRVQPHRDRGDAVGWFQGRMEFGPRALGNRSILGDPRKPDMQKTLNLKIKFRESFRPFAPSVLAEDVADYFEIDVASPYMLMVADVKRNRRRHLSTEEKLLFGINQLNVPRSDIPAVTHVDHSARVQTVHAETNARYHALISRFKERTGCGVLVNTSFNVRGEPIVGSPEDAFRCFMGTGMETLAIGNCLLSKANQNPDLVSDYSAQFAPD